MDTPMTMHDLLAWQESMGYTSTAAAAALGISRPSFHRLATGKSAIDKRTALACSALEAGLAPWSVQYQLGNASPARRKAPRALPSGA